MSKIIPINKTSRLIIIITNDLNALSNMMRNKEMGRFRDLIESLIKFKKWTYNHILGSRNSNLLSIPAPFQPELKTYGTTSNRINNKQLKLLGVIKSIEFGQMKFIKELMSSKVTSWEMKTTLGGLVIKYQKIIDQMERMQKTHDLRAVVL